MGEDKNTSHETFQHLDSLASVSEPILGESEHLRNSTMLMMNEIVESTPTSEVSRVSPSNVSQVPRCRNLMKEKGLKGSAKHCVYGVCRSDARYPERSPANMRWIPFPKVGVIKPGMEQWKVAEARARTEKCKRWVHACGRPNFSIWNITRNTYICSLHFIETTAHPDPVKATHSIEEVEIRRNRAQKRRRAPKKVSTPMTKKHCPLDDAGTDSLVEMAETSALPPSVADMSDMKVIFFL